jgi:hypothetical protein
MLISYWQECIVISQAICSQNVVFATSHKSICLPSAFLPPWPCAPKGPCWNPGRDTFFGPRHRSFRENPQKHLLASVFLTLALCSWRALPWSWTGVLGRDTVVFAKILKSICLPSSFLPWPCAPEGPCRGPGRGLGP